MHRSYLVASTADALFNNHVIDRLIIYTQDECGPKLLVVGGLAVCQTAAILQTAGSPYTPQQQPSSHTHLQLWQDDQSTEAQLCRKQESMQQTEAKSLSSKYKAATCATQSNIAQIG